MVMPIKIRPDFIADANFLDRLKRAIEIDDKRDVDWKRQITEKINEVVILLRKADIAELEKENDEAASR